MYVNQCCRCFFIHAFSFADFKYMYVHVAALSLVADRTPSLNIENFSIVDTLVTVIAE